MATIVFDENFGRPAVCELAAFYKATYPQIEILSLLQIFPAGALDQYWIPRLAAMIGLIVVSHDRGKRCGGAKFPDICREYKVTHVLVGPSIQRLKNAEKMAYVSHKIMAIADLAKEPQGSRFTLQLDGVNLRLVKAK